MGFLNGMGKAFETARENRLRRKIEGIWAKPYRALIVRNAPWEVVRRFRAKMGEVIGANRDLREAQRKLSVLSESALKVMDDDRNAQALSQKTVEEIKRVIGMV